MTVESDFATALVANATSGGYTGLAVGVSVFPFAEVEATPEDRTVVAPAVAIPDKAVFITKTDGIDSSATFDSSLFETFFLEIEIRGGVEDLSGTATLAEAVKFAVERRPPTGYLNAFVVGTAPRYEGKDEKQRPRWRVRLAVERQTTIGASVSGTY